MKALLVLIAALAVLAAACGGSDSKKTILRDIPAARVTPTVTASSDAVPTRTPTPVPTPAGPPGRVATNVTAICRLGDTDAIIYVTYRAQAIGTQMHRVRLMLNDKVMDDSGEIYDTNFDKVATIHVVSGKRYTLTVDVSAPNAFIPQIANIVGCPRNAGPAA